MYRKSFILGILATILIAGTLFFIMRSEFSSGSRQSNDSSQGNDNEPSVDDPETVAQNLSVPWGLAFLPNGDLLVSERPGTIKRIGRDRQTYTIQGVEHTSEGGLLGVVLHPDFEDNEWMYLYKTTRVGGRLVNQIERYTYQSNQLIDRQLIFGGIPGSEYHDGGRLAFGPDGLLYVTTGDAGDGAAAQDTTSLAGKILRIRDDGSVPNDNPFGNAVYSYGHRNPQGIAWDADGGLWSTEHGRSGSRSGYDELNLIEKGANYGWPIIEGDMGLEGMRRPVIHSGSDETWAPAGLAYLDGALYFAGLRGQTLYRAVIQEDASVRLTKHFVKQYGRMRTTAVDKNDRLYVTTSNTDGRGSPAENDDKIIRLNRKITE